VEAPARQARVVDEVAHRPWPLPEQPWLQAQTWENLLFAHWQVEEATLRKHVPEELELDTYDGSAWLGMTPFRVSGLRLRGTLPPPRLSDWLELNVRTYVVVDDRPGIYFLSLDANSRFAVRAAKRLYQLPYHHARIRAEQEGAWTDFSCERGDLRFEARYRPIGLAQAPEPGSVEHFLTERYRLYVVSDGRIHAADIHHPPWPLQPAEAAIARNTIALELEGEPLTHFSRRRDVVIWPLQKDRRRVTGYRSGSSRYTSPRALAT
jgi:uncharacterized protein